jgi:hypothetical protein
MTNAEFRATLTKAFDTHMFMNERDRHTVNELLHILRHDNAFKDKDYNISIYRKNGEWWCVPTLDAFVSVPCLSIWFEDERVEFEIEECLEEKYNCITIYESEEN